MIQWLVIPIIFSATFIQGTAGFGAGLIAMPLLIQVLGIQVAAPLFALTIQVNGLLMVLRYGRNADWRKIWPIALAMFLTIPLGVLLARVLEQQLAMTILGAVITIYALYMLLGSNPIEVHPRWRWVVGSLSGMLSGAYNVGGPPLIIYGTSQNWPPNEFKGNLQTLFFSTGFVVIVSHIINHNFTPIVWQHFLLTAPSLFAGQWLASRLDARINPVQFRKLVLGLLVVLGVSMVL